MKWNLNNCQCKKKKKNHLPKCEVRRRMALYRASNTPCTLRLRCLDLCHVQRSANIDSRFISSLFRSMVKINKSLYRRNLRTKGAKLGGKTFPMLTRAASRQVTVTRVFIFVASWFWKSRSIGFLLLAKWYWLREYEPSMDIYIVRNTGYVYWEDNRGVLRSNILLAGNEIIRFIYATDLRKTMVRIKTRV